MSEVSWKSSYNIEIDNIDIEIVDAINSALRTYLRSSKKEVNLSNDVITTFNQIIEVCESISDVDDSE